MTETRTSLVFFTSKKALMDCPNASFLPAVCLAFCTAQSVQMSFLKLMCPGSPARYRTFPMPPAFTAGSLGRGYNTSHGRYQEQESYDMINMNTKCGALSHGRRRVLCGACCADAARGAGDIGTCCRACWNNRSCMSSPSGASGAMWR